MNKTGILTILKRAGNSLQWGILFPICLPICLLIMLIYWLLKNIFKKVYALLRGMHYDGQSEKFISKEEYKKKKEEEKKEEQKERIKEAIIEGKLKTTDLPHVTKHPFTSFLCIEDSKDNLPYDVVAYIETVPNETIRKFYSEEKDWIKQLSAKYGIDFIQADYDKIRSIMLYPQDFKELHHGIIWRTHYSTSEREYGLFGINYLYFELTPGTHKQLKQQLEDAMIKIYDCFLNHSLIAI